MLWDHYVFRRGTDASSFWESHFSTSESNILFITGKGFDKRAIYTLEEWLKSIHDSRSNILNAELLLVDFNDYDLTEELHSLTDENVAAFRALFSPIGNVIDVEMFPNPEDEEPSSNQALFQGLNAVLQKIDPSITDILLDISSLPRVVYLTLMTGILERLIPDKSSENSLYANGVNFQVIVAEDANLDSSIQSEDPSSELIKLPGFAAALEAESLSDWSLVWFPILGENRIGQLNRLLSMDIIPGEAEICPVLPFPSEDPRRADKLLVEYRELIFDKLSTPMANILYAHETNPFEAYRKLYNAMFDYRESLEIISGCRILVTPLASKLITTGAGLACFEMKPVGMDAKHAVAIPYVEQTRYQVSRGEIERSKPQISTLLLTGRAYFNQ